jgi:CubicO group peptidase (beta-lactamase class C family)
MESDALVNIDSRRHRVAQSFGGISMTTRDLAKIGRLYMNGGVWNGKRIVSEDWIRQSTAYDTSNDGYHFNWYNTSNVGEPKPEHPGFYALGIKMQVLYVNPDLNLIMVRLGMNNSGAVFHPLLFETLANIWISRQSVPH